MLNCQVFTKTNQTLTSNKSKHLLIENELKKLKALIRFIIEAKVALKKMAHKIIQYFNLIQKYFERIAGVGNGNHIYYQKSKGLSDERINSV